MKKQILYFIIIVMGLVSCNTERSGITAAEQIKAEQVSRFQNAIRDLGKPENRPTAEEIRAAKSIELSDRRKDLLIPTAIEMIKSSGVSEYELKQKTQGDRDKILTWAVKIYNAYKIDLSHSNNN